MSFVQMPFLIEEGPFWLRKALSIPSLLKFVFKSGKCVQFSCSVWLFATPWAAACQASLSITNSRSSLKLTSIESVMPSSHLILCHPLFSLSPIPPASESFPMSQLFAWGGQSTGVSALASVLPKNTQSISRWMDKKAMVHIHNGVLLSH